MAQFVFQRTEKKYLVNETQYNNLLKSINRYMKADEYGEYTICNIYFDTEKYDLIRTSIEKPLFKEKLRLRSYGVPNEKSTVYLEIKRKFKGVVYKRRIALPYDEMMNYLETGRHPQNDNQVFHEIDYFMNFYKPEPKVYLAYDRVAFKGNDDNTLRITFDSNIRSRECNLELSKGCFGDFLIKDGTKVMEIKTSNSMPLWLCDRLNELEIYPSSFSKYGNVYINKIKSKEGVLQCLQA